MGKFLGFLLGLFTAGVGVVIIYLICYGISALAFWGIGNFIIWAFAINFIWTFWHGLAVAIIFGLLKDLFKRKD